MPANEVVTPEEKTNIRPMTKDELAEVVREQLQKGFELRGLIENDEMKGFIKETCQEVINQIEPPKKTPFGEDGGEDPKGGYKSFAEFAKDVYDAGAELAHPNERLSKWMEKSENIQKAAGSPAQSAGSLQSGGALIPPEFARTALTRAKERSAIMGRATIVPMSSNKIDIPYIKDFDQSQGKVAGNVKFRWVNEQDQAAGNEVQLGTVGLTLHEANCLVFVGNQLMKFSPVSIEPFITTAVTDALDLALADTYLNGSGSNQPLGVLKSDVLVQVAKETGQAADTIVYENTLQMLAQFYGNNGVWFGNRTIIPQLGVMNVTVGTGGTAVYLAGSGDGTNGFPKNAGLHGAPLYWDQVCPRLGNPGDLGIFDWSQYLVGEFSGGIGLEMTESSHLKFDYRQHAFQWTFYIDGRPWWPTKFTPKNGDDLSPFVVIAER